MDWPYVETESLLFEALKNKPSGNHWDLVSEVILLAITKKLYPVTMNNNSVTPDYSIYLEKRHQNEVPELIRQLMWKLLIKGIIVFGSDDRNGNFPNYRITYYGLEVVDGQKPQPYDPNSFLSEFKNDNPNADYVIYSYLEEAVNSFNSSCLKSSAIMLGAASEKAILLLLELFATKISDPTKKQQFERDLSNNWMISTRFRFLYDRLSLMANGNRFPRNSDLKDIVIRDLPGIFDLVRRLRNTAGHPELISPIREDTMFLNLRVFSEYIKSIYKLMNYFSSNDADW